MDETTDISRTEQLSLCVRYIDVNEDPSRRMREDFLEFVAVHNIPGKNLAIVVRKFTGTWNRLTIWLGKAMMILLPRAVVLKAYMIL